MINSEVQNNPDTENKTDANLLQQNTETNLDQQVVGNEKLEDLNFKAFREGRKKDRLEKEAAERKALEKEKEVAALKAAMEAAFSKSAPSPESYQQYYGINQQQEETEDERLEKKLNKLLAQKEEQYRKELFEQEQREYPTRLAKNFPDFKQVCSQENLDYLDYHYPELTSPLNRLPDGYDKWADIYRAVKKFIPNHASAKKDAARADMNSQKPKSISTSSITPSGNPVKESWQEAEQRRASNWERMQRTMKGV